MKLKKILQMKKNKKINLIKLVLLSKNVEPIVDASQTHTLKDNRRFN
jgi:hypothetical protein